MKTIKKRPTLKDVLRTLPINEPHEIKSRDYRAAVVRRTVSTLRKEGYQFKATEEGLIDSIEVTRLR